MTTNFKDGLGEKVSAYLRAKGLDERIVIIEGQPYLLLRAKDELTDFARACLEWAKELNLHAN